MSMRQSPYLPTPGKPRDEIGQRNQTDPISMRNSLADVQVMIPLMCAFTFTFRFFPKRLSIPFCSESPLRMAHLPTSMPKSRNPVRRTPSMSFHFPWADERRVTFLTGAIQAGNRQLRPMQKEPLERGNRNWLAAFQSCDLVSLYDQNYGGSGKPGIEISAASEDPRSEVSTST